jgi:NADH-quinone oxidoreductase subunit J
MEYAQPIFFLAFAAIAVVAAVAVVVNRSPLQSALALIVCFGAFAAEYVMLQAQFIAAIQIIVYAGAIIVLFVFVIMLLSVRAEDSLIEPGRARKVAAVVVVGGAMLASLLYVMRPIKTVGGYSVAKSASVGTVESVGKGLFTDYLLPFEMTSVLIIMAIVGAMVLARRAADIRPEPEVALLPSADADDDEDDEPESDEPEEPEARDEEEVRAQ